MSQNISSINIKVFILISGLFLLSVAFLFYITPNTASAHDWIGCPAEGQQFYCECSGRHLDCTRTDAPGSCTLNSNFLDHRHSNHALCSPGSIITIKQVDGTSGRSYDFVTSVIKHPTTENTYAFSLSDGEEFEIDEIIAGVYQVKEILPPNVIVDSITCISDIEPPQITVNLEEAYVIISLRRLEDVECTFHNVEAIPELENENQYKSDGITVIPEGDTTTEDTIVFKSNLTSFQNTDAKLQVELRQFNEPFTGSFDGGIIESSFISSGQEASITRFGLVDGQYHWRARAVDENGNASDWQEFGTPGNVDFEVAPLGGVAADLAKEVIFGAYLGDGDTFGGKGWDPFQRKYVTPGEIFDGYNYWNNKLRSVEFGAGLDCSGLTQWAYNYSFDPTKSLTRNVVWKDGADGQYRENTSTVSENDLRPGDLMFFDPDNDNFITHVAMYVGNSTTPDGQSFDVIEAASQDLGIIPSRKDVRKTDPGFQNLGTSGFRKIAPSSKLAGQVKAFSPINLTVTDPEGFTITPGTFIQTDEEYLTEIPGELYYTETVFGDDGRPNDIVYWPKRKIGDYRVQVSPEPDALPTETYSLEFTSGEQVIMLAEDYLIENIPEQPYIVRIEEDGEGGDIIETIIPVQIRIEPETLNLTQKGVFTVFPVLDEGFGYTLDDIDLFSVLLEGASPTSTSLNRGKNELMLRFNTQDITNVTASNEVELILSGTLSDGTSIEGKDIVKVLSKGKPFFSRLWDSFSEVLSKALATILI